MIDLNNFERIIAFTGHRPKYLPGGYDHTTPANQWLRLQIQYEVLKIVGPYPLDKCAVISGMALGVDQWALAWTMKVLGKEPTYVAAIPCKNQEAKWPKNAQLVYDTLLNLTDEQIYISNLTYMEDPTCMNRRNIWTIDHCTNLIAVYDPKRTNSGTAHAIKYAKQKERDIKIFNPYDWNKE